MKYMKYMTDHGVGCRYDIIEVLQTQSNNTFDKYIY